MFTGLMLIVCSLLGQPPQPTNEDLKLEVRRLIEELDSDELARRDAAEQALIEKGPAVLDLLPADNRRLSAEVRQRLARIRNKLQQLAVAATLQPALITLRADGLPLFKILDALKQQSGNTLVDYRAQFGQPVSDPKLKVNFDKEPFWQALDQVLDQAGLTVYPYSDQAGLNLVNRSADELPRVKSACYSGPFRFEPVLLLAQRKLLSSQPGSLRLVIEAAWEPRLKPIMLFMRLANTEAVDDLGQPLTVQSAAAEMEVPIETLKSAVELSLPFALPPRQAREIARIKGKLTAIIPGKIEEFRFGDLLKAKNVEKRIAGVTVTLEQVRHAHEVLEVYVQVRFDEPGDALASHRGWIWRNQAYLEVPGEKPIAYDSLETTEQTKNQFGARYIFPVEKPTADVNFVYKTPTAILQAEVEYEFHHLKLP
jgi:hypothetical protein